MVRVEQLLSILGLYTFAAPFVLFGVLGIGCLVSRPMSERATSRFALVAIWSGFLAALGMVLLMFLSRTSHFALELGNWIEVPHFHFTAKLLFDGLSLPFVILAYLLCGTIGGFANRYLHREPGYTRFFVLYAMFVAGMAMTALAGTIETLFTGWELVGLSSALLVAFFHERPMPVQNGLRVWSVYRVSDAALLIAAVVLHHLRGEGDFDHLFGTGAWPSSQAFLPAADALLVGLLLVVAAAGKSALVPFSGWLPRAMEGPTPSSAVFYGAISVHLGAYLLLRVSPVIELSPALAAIIVALGLTTAGFAALAGRVQTDIKSALSFASLTQVGIIVAEIGFGFDTVALLHLIGHACLRTLQFVRAPTLLQDYRFMENAIGSRLPRQNGFFQRLVPESTRTWFYRLALERGYWDAWLSDYIARPFVRFFQWCDARERQWNDFLTGNLSEPEALATKEVHYSAAAASSSEKVGAS